MLKIFLNLHQGKHNIHEKVPEIQSSYTCRISMFRKNWRITFLSQTARPLSCTWTFCQQPRLSKATQNNFEEFSAYYKDIFEDEILCILSVSSLQEDLPVEIATVSHYQHSYISSQQIFLQVQSITPLMISPFSCLLFESVKQNWCLGDSKPTRSGRTVPGTKPNPGLILSFLPSHLLI